LSKWSKVLQKGGRLKKRYAFGKRGKISKRIEDVTTRGP